MANGAGTAGTILSAASPALGAIPVVGSILSGATSIIGGVLQADAAKDQAAQAAKIREDALRAKKQALRPEFMKKLRIDQMQALEGLPGLETLKNQLGENTAANVRAIRESSTSGAQTLAGVASLTGAENNEIGNLGIKNAEMKAAGLSKVGNTLWDIGLQERGLEDRRDEVKKEGLAAAADLEAKATANKMEANKQIIGAVGATGTSLLNAAPELGEIDFKRKMYNITKKKNLGQPLSGEEINFIKSQGLDPADYNTENSGMSFLPID